MHVAIIIDQERLSQEQSMLNRLCIGLITEGTPVTRIVPDCALPDSADKAEKRMALAKRIETPMRVLLWMRRARIDRIAEKVEKSPPDVLYAVGEQAWPLGMELGIALQRPVLIDVCSPRQAQVAPLVKRESAIAGYVACSAAIAGMLKQRVDASLVSVAPFGVAIPTEPREALPKDEVPAMAVIGGARDVRAYEQMFEGMSQLVREGAGFHVFLELRGPLEHDVWRRAEKLDVLPFISAIGEASLYRSLLTRCHLLLMPERYGELRSLMLEAMALGIPIIARKDPAVDVLIEGATAMLIEQGTAAEWLDRLRGALREPEKANGVGESARRQVEAHHRSSDQVNRLLETLTRTCTGGTVKFAAKPG